MKHTVLESEYEAVFVDQTGYPANTILQLRGLAAAIQDSHPKWRPNFSELADILQRMDNYKRLVSAGASYGAAKQIMEVYLGPALLLFGAALNAVGIMPNDNLSVALYCTRHTFISLALTAGENIKAIAEQCGSSAQMIEQHYGRYMSSDFGARMMAELEQKNGNGNGNFRG